jgi:hypothetical protein
VLLFRTVTERQRCDFSASVAEKAQCDFSAPPVRTVLPSAKSLATLCHPPRGVAVYEVSGVATPPAYLAASLAVCEVSGHTVNGGTDLGHGHTVA